MNANTTSLVLNVAAQHHGVCTYATLLEAGVSRATISRRLADGTLVLVRNGVYEAPLAAVDATPLARAIMAIPGSALSRQTAARTNGFPIAAPSQVHVTAPKGAGRTLQGVVVHESRQLSQIDIVADGHGFPTTSPARTIFDLAGDLGPHRLEHVVRTQTAAGCPTLDQLHRCFARLARRGRPGVVALRAILDVVSQDGPTITQSELEATVWSGLRRHRIAGFVPQFRPPWFDGRRGIVDFGHERARVIVEADGRRWHARHDSMVDDRRRDRQAAVDGWIVVRVMWEDLVDKDETTFAELAEIVATRLRQRAA